MPLSNDIYNAFEDIVGKRNISDDPALLDSYRYPLSHTAIHLGPYYRTYTPRGAAVLLPGNSEEVQAILDNTILLFNVVQNPDGRVMGTRRNANDIDINRDFITQSQPETRATVGVITEWNPMVFLDLHGFVNPMPNEKRTSYSVA